MKVAFLTDLHVTEDRLHPPADQMATFAKIRDSILNAMPDLVLVGGDLCGFHVPHRATPTERNVLVSLFVSLGNVAPVVIVRGNHDEHGDYDFFNSLSARHSISYITEPEVLSFRDDTPFDVYVMPWLDKTRFSAAVDYETSVRTEAYGLVNGARIARERGGPGAAKYSFLLAHAAMLGAEIRVGQPNVPTRDPILDTGIVCNPDAFDACFFGHYHGYQMIAAHPPSVYGGSCTVNEYGEPSKKGWVLFQTGAEGMKHMGVAQPRRVKIEWDAGQEICTTLLGRKGVGRGADLKALTSYDWKGCLVKLVVQVPPDGVPNLAETTARLRIGLAETADYVKVEYRTARKQRTRVGAVAVSKAKTTAEKVETYLKTLDPKPRQFRIKEALDVLKEIERTCNPS